MIDDRALAPVEPFASDEPWGIEFVEGADGHWDNRWFVRADHGEGWLLAIFEFSSHAEAFVERCGPEGSSTEWRAL